MYEVLYIFMEARTVSTAMSKFMYDLPIKYRGMKVLFIHIYFTQQTLSHKEITFVIISLSTKFMAEKCDLFGRRVKMVTDEFARAFLKSNQLNRRNEAAYF
jgi:hypothetical protein